MIIKKIICYYFQIFKIIQLEKKNEELQRKEQL